MIITSKLEHIVHLFICVLAVSHFCYVHILCWDFFMLIWLFLIYRNPLCIFALFLIPTSSLVYVINLFHLDLFDPGFATD